MPIRRPMPRRRIFAPRRTLLSRIRHRRPSASRVLLRARRRLFARAFYRRAPMK